ncbi:MAG: sigma-70 family RNA polymerase sigma factor, partial [Caldisericia bacterium]|nr:sigma-70 family RNA polymerase sigma factor [Caldisericia bacterium]
DYVVKKYKKNHKNIIDELKSVGNIGLIKAAERFDDKREASFVTYATIIVNGEIKHYLRDNSDVIRITRKHLEVYKEVMKIIDLHIEENGNAPSTKEVAERSKYSEKQIIAAMVAAYAKFPVSIDEPIMVDSEKMVYGDTISEKRDYLEERIQMNTVDRAIMKLPEDEKRSIILRYKFELTNKEIAEMLHLKQYHVSKLVRSGLNKMKETIEEDVGNKKITEG